MTGPRSPAVRAPHTICGRSVMVSIGDPFAVLNRFAFITYSYYVNMTFTYARFFSASLSREKTSRIIDMDLRCKGLLRREFINTRARPRQEDRPASAKPTIGCIAAGAMAPRPMSRLIA